MDKQLSSELKDIISTLRKNYQYTWEHISNKIGVSEHILKNYMYGKTEPPAKLIIEIKKLFNKQLNEIESIKKKFDELEYLRERVSEQKLLIELLRNKISKSD